MSASAGQESHSLLFCTFLAGLVATPAFLGSNHPVMWTINAIVFAGLLIAYELPRIIGGRSHEVSLRHAGWPLLLFACTLAWIIAQISTLTPDSWHHPVWKLASAAHGTPLPGRISVSTEQTVLALLRLCTAGAVFWLALQMARTPAAAYKLLRWIALSAGFYAAAGFFWLAFAPDLTLWFKDQATRGWFHGPFVNRNHYGAYAGLGLIAALGLILRARRTELDSGGTGIRMRLRALLNLGETTGLLLPTAAMLLFVSLLLTGSRGAIAASAVGVAVLGALASRRSEGEGRGELLAIAALAIAGGLFLYGDLLMNRVAQDGVIDGGRKAVWPMIWNAILANPWLGYGYGAFADAFPMVRDGSLDIRYVWDKAHNSWLETLHGLGIPAGLAFIFCISGIVWKILRGARARHRAIEVPAVAVASAALIASHACVDFSLQLQAITLHFAALLGAGLAQSFSSSQDTGDPSSGQ